MGMLVNGEPSLKLMSTKSASRSGGFSMTYTTLHMSKR